MGQCLGTAEIMGARFSEATATEALSITRLMTISVTSGGDLHGGGGDLCDLVGRLVFACEILLALVDPDVVELNPGAPYVVSGWL